MDCTILLPCLNEEANIAYVIDQAREWLDQSCVDGEILVVDNGSVDRSVSVAKTHGAKVIREKQIGYGYALRRGLSEAKGQVIIFGDADGTYEFSDLGVFYEPLSKNEYDLIIGNRFAGRMEEGAMNVSHRIGVSVLSWLAGRRFDVPVRDYHCGIRGIRKDALDKCSFHTGGMEFATEMIAEAGRQDLRLKEVSVPLKVSRFKRQAKLRPIRDGLRHLSYIVANSNDKGTAPGSASNEKRKALIILNYQYEIPPFMQTILYYADEVFDRIYYVYPASDKKTDIRAYSKKIRFIAVPKKTAYKLIIKLPVFFLKRGSREQLHRAVQDNIPLLNLVESMAVHNIWADCFELTVNRMFQRGLADRKNTVILSTWFSAEALAGAGLKRKYPELRFISMAHSFEIDRIKNPLVAYEYNRTKHQFCDHIYFVSDKMRKQYYRDVRKLIPKGEWEKTSVLPLGSRKLYPDRFVPGSADGILRLLSVSDVIPVKRIDRIIDSLSAWDGPDIEWTHFGGGVQLEKMKERAAKKLGRNEYISYRFMGEVDNAKIHEYYNLHCVDLFINVSTTEGVPISLRECMCYGVPAIATDAGGNAEIVTDGAGFLISKDFSDQELRGVIKHYIEMTAEEKEKMRAAAFLRWKENFDSAVITRRFLSEISG
ncbi:MAG: glycosyltransferase [Lachnospiraceae bacterium]|nr:glycosyltransferase [Lachnospiraceae bacterium]